MSVRLPFAGRASAGAGSAGSAQSSSPFQVLPEVRAGSSRPTALAPDLAERIVRVVVDTHLHLPDMFEITFLEPDPLDSSATDERALQPGCTVEILAAATTGEEAGTLLVSGEITSVEAVCQDMSVHTVVRGFDPSHRLHRGRSTRTFLNSSDGQIAQQVAKDAGLSIGEVRMDGMRYAHVSQVAESDWAFLRRRARALGWETGVREGKFYFRPPANSGPGGGLLSGGSGPVTLAFGDNLLSFRPRLNPSGPARQVEVRAWDAQSGRAVSATSDVRDTRKGPTGAAVTHTFDRPLTPSNQRRASKPDRVDLVLGAPAVGAAAAQGLTERAKGLATLLAGTRGEAEGWLMGHPGVQAGAEVDVQDVPKSFAGRWRVSQAHHVFSKHDGYRTRFTSGGSEDRSLHGLAHGSGTGERPAVEGVVCAVVSDINDPSKQGRVRLHLPWLADDYESDWARVAQFGAGAKGGALFLPGVGDEVLVGFELGDAGRPVVLGSLVNPRSTYTAKGLGGPAVQTRGKTAEVARHGFVSDTGNRLVFTDAGGSKAASEVSLSNADGNLALVIDQQASTVTLKCDAASSGRGGARKLLIQCDGGAVTVDAGANGTVNVKAGMQGKVLVDGGEIAVSAGRKLSLTSKGELDIKGTVVKVSGTPIKLN
ncbi:VgrG-related protein [Streptomyces sp. WAC06614]|uniref:VgrG-related protein n=1 Tax=Streptomyces sp. WAC06614 TaxID=2487416 RepID=UPI00163B8D23|nr:VgrG-related protein [Streptomyces sp. WAC06614]